MVSSSASSEILVGGSSNFGKTDEDDADDWRPTIYLLYRTDLSMKFAFVFD